MQLDLGRVVGENGLTPRIENDYWYIGDENTGICARGSMSEVSLAVVGNGSTFEEAGEKGAIKISIKDNVAYIWTKQEE